MLLRMKTVAPTALIVLIIASSTAQAQDADSPADRAPLRVVDELLDATQPATLGLAMHPDAETFTVFSPGDDDNRFNHGAVITQFDGKLYVQWQTSRQDEDSPDTHVVYSTSTDGESWSAPVILGEAPAGAMTTSGGWWVYDNELVAFINVWPRAGDIGQGGYTMFSTSSDGDAWSTPAPVTDADGVPVPGIFEQDPRALADGRIISAFHLQPGLVVAPFFTDDPGGTTGWTRGRMTNLPFEGNVSREIEPSWFEQGANVIVMVFRDQAESFRKLAASSLDRGASWTTPVLTNIPDARTKQSAGNLPDGTAFLVGNPVSSKARYPLVVMLGHDGQTFDRAWLLRAAGDALPAMRFAGQYKRPGYSYPKSAVINDWLYVAYATNKEDIEITRVPVNAL
jgi:hypothetical protein